MRLIVNADDFGLTAGVNQAVLLAVRRGILSSASLMVNQEASEAAIQYLKSGLVPNAGVHLCITVGRPITDPPKIPSLVDEDGLFHRPSSFVRKAPNPRQILLEFKAQIEKALARGVPVTHLDTHHHIHRHPAVFEALTDAAQYYNLPVRHLDLGMRDELRRRGVATPDLFCGEWIGSEATLENFQRLVLAARNEGYQLMELMTHPGLADSALAARSSYVTERQRELAVLCAPETQAWLDEQGVELCDYSACPAPVDM